MTGSRAPMPDDHAAHDRFLVAAFADARPDLDPAAADRARALLAACTECAGLYADLQALALALPQTATPPRPRDFTLTEADAARLRPRGLRRWLGLIGSSRDTISRPLALGFTTLGLAGLLVATVPGALPGSAGGAAASAAPVTNAIGAPAEAASEAPAALQVSEAPATSKVDDGGVFSGSDSGDPTVAPADGLAQGGTSDDAATTRDARAATDGSGPLVPLAAILTLVGLGLFALRWSARRVTER